MSPAPKKNNRPRPGLGRGLGALIGQHPAETAHPDADAGSGKNVQAAPTAAGTHPAAAQASHDDRRHVAMLPVADISRSTWQPRQTFDEAALKDLTDSIKTHGVIQPLICRRGPSGGYELIAGERRLRASMLAGLGQVPVILIEAVDRDAAEMAIIENIQREDLNAIEEAEGYRTLADKFGLTQQDVADRVGKARASVANALRLLELPDEVKQLLGSSQLSTGHAKVLLSVSDPKEQVLLSRKCVTDGLTVRALERLLVRRQQTRSNEKRGPNADIPDSHLKHLSDRLHSQFSTSVRLTPSMTHANGKRVKGRIEIDFFDNDDLDRLLTLLGIEVD
ncbi:MAG: ParB/RepB/Spo0J family partition protein [Kiritimatiellia bacterium]